MLSVVALLWLAVGGCSSVRVPAIDPTGANLFAPSGSYTTLESPHSLLPASCLPRPAFTSPPSIPACPTPSQIGSVPIQPRPARTVASTNIPDRLLLTPSKIVAPVGSEVVLLAGLAGADGYFVAKQPVEWILSQESVGNFVDIGENDSPTLSHLLHRSPEKRSSNFAVARTTAKATTITRGTPATNDDIALQKGQTWLTLTSASEGISYVTAVATKADNWEQRRQTATIQWVDAQWLLPSPTVSRAGQAEILTTTITRNSSRSPVQNWLVRYHIVSGPAAGFGVERAQSVEVVTDMNGKAAVSLQPLGSEPGTTQVRVEILSPSLTGLNGQPVVVGQGTTSVTWSSAGLVTRVSGPAMSVIGATMDYQIQVTNPGDLPSENITVTAEVPPLLRVLSADQDQLGANATWTIDRLAPGGSQTLNLQCRAMAAGSVRLFVRANGNGIEAQQSHVDTQITESALQLTMELADNSNVDSVPVGGKITYNITITNTSTVPLTNVQLRDNYDTGLEEAHHLPNPISKSVGDLAPGQSWPTALSFNVIQPGRHCNTLTVTADGGHSASIERCVQAAAPRYGLSMAVRGPEEVLTGETAEYEVVVTNTGGAELTGVRILIRSDEALLPKRATENYQMEAGAFVWKIATLGVGQSTEPMTLRCEASSPSNAATTTFLVGSDQGLDESKRITTAIRRASAPGVAPPGPPRSEVRNASPSVAAQGALLIKIADTDDPIRVGETVSYIIEIENTRQVPDKNVEVTFYLPEGAKFVTLLGNNGQEVEERHISPNGSAVSVHLKEIRADEKLPAYRLQVEGQQPGEMTLQVEVRSLLGGEQPIVATHSTKVSAN
jgi:uncharacterized repeat protein (TIGR01451 family)